MFWVFVLLFVGLLALYKFFLGYSKDSRKVCVGDQSSSTAVTLLKGLLRGLVKRSGVLQGQVSEVRLQLSPVLSQTEVESYERATVFSGGRAEKNKTQVATALSVCFPQVLSVRPSAGLIVSQGFPMSPLGIVHIQQTITQHKVLPVTGNYALEVFFARYPSGLMYAETDKGIELTIRVTLADRKSKELFWEGDTVVLSRAKAPGKRSGPAPVFESPVWDQQAQLTVHGNTGRRYAAASGDYNPHHLFWWSALPMGFSRPIAHGMWTLSAALHELEAYGAIQTNKYPRRVSCDFKKPLLMPATITFGYRKTGLGVQFGVYNKDNTDPHLIGVVFE